jgi:hypothetical protein
VFAFSRRSIIYLLVVAGIGFGVLAGSRAGADASGKSKAHAERSAQAGLSGDVRLQQIDGGPNYFAKFSNSASFDNPKLFPIAVFDQGLGYWHGYWDPVSGEKQIRAYKREGINGYVNLYNGYNRPLLNALKAAGQWAFTGPLAPSYPNPIAGYVWFDEPDGQNDCSDIPGASVLGQAVGCSKGAYSGSPSASEIAQVTADLQGAKGKGDPTRIIYGNYTGGAIAWPNPPSSAAAGYVRAVDVVSFDDYIINGGYDFNHNLWRQYNDVKNVRAEAHDSRPVWSFIEAGDTEGGGSWSGIWATPAEEVAEAWNAIIGGARGIEWFDHDFGPFDGDYNTTSSADLIDTSHPYVALRKAIAAFDHAVTRLAPVINSPFAQNYVKHTGAMNVMAKYYRAGNEFYVFAAPRANRPLRVTFTVADGYSGPVRVIGQKKTLTAKHGRFTDEFANDTIVHVYEIPNVVR